MARDEVQNPQPHDLETGADELETGGNRLLQDDADIWIVGDSIPFWAGERAKTTGKANLRLDGRTIAWWGVRGLRWSGFRRTVQSQVLLSPPPSAIVIHLGGNDLHDLSIIKIKKSIRSEIRYLREAFPDTVLIWIDILPRRIWRGDFSPKVIDEKTMSQTTETCGTEGEVMSTRRTQLQVHLYRLDTQVLRS
ncbi:uncharacterized protein LOC123555069 [Mercenaria mercenaria]|uniref:uncharacterized protein LOC123555069 n=1 Tax=Mercenaria mercenaria TaxID=6596 RepID=UPI00234E7786|nr:uncharacterized protein LOC123555069 [Mercenaria mercenaria]